MEELITSTTFLIRVLLTLIYFNLYTCDNPKSPKTYFHTATKTSSRHTENLKKRNDTSTLLISIQQ